MSWAIVAGAAVSVVGGAVANRQNKPASVSNESAITPEQHAALRSLLDRLQLPGGGVTPYNGRMSTGVTPGQQTSLAALEEQAMSSVRSGEEDRNFLRQAMADASKGTSPDTINSTFRDTVENPALKTFNEQTLPGVSKRFKGNSIFGSDAREAERRATMDLGDSLTSSRAKFSFDATESAKDRALRAALGGTGLLQQGGRNNVQSMLDLFGAHGMIAGQEQGGLDRGYQEFVRQRGENNTNIQHILQAIGMGTQNTVVNPGQPGFLTSAAPGIGNAYTQWMLSRMGKGGSGTTPAGGGIDWSLDSGMG